MALHLLRRRDRRSISARLAIVVAAAIALVAATCGIAIAYWSSSGSGSGQGTTGSMDPITVTATTAADSAGTTLIPGQPGDVILRVNNPNAYPVHVTAIAGNGIVTAGNGCAPTDVTFTAPTDYSAAQFTLTTGSHLITLSGAASMGLTSASACQGTTFTIPVAVTVQK